MIYLVMRGACGNQFFQYAFARALQEKTGQALRIDWRYVKNSKILWNGGEDSLQYFNTVSLKEGNVNRTFQWKVIYLLKLIERVLGMKEFQKRTYRFLLKCAKLFNRWGVYYYDAAYYPYEAAKTKNIVILGYFESPKFFEEIDAKICNELTVREQLDVINEGLYQKILETESVCVTIRRKNLEIRQISHIYAYDIQYFYDAINYIKRQKPDAVLFVFSDDIEWCRENIKYDGEMYFETGNDPIWEKVRLMSACKHFIISNSTFSWWVQHLSRNKEKIVIAPAKWMNRDDQPIDLYEDNWIYITKDGKVVTEHE